MKQGDIVFDINDKRHKVVRALTTEGLVIVEHRRDKIQFAAPDQLSKIFCIGQRVQPFQIIGAEYDTGGTLWLVLKTDGRVQERRTVEDLFEYAQRVSMEDLEVDHRPVLCLSTDENQTYRLDSMSGGAAPGGFGAVLYVSRGCQHEPRRYIAFDVLQTDRVFGVWTALVCRQIARYFRFK